MMRTSKLSGVLVVACVMFIVASQIRLRAYQVHRPRGQATLVEVEEVAPKWSTALPKGGADIEKLTGAAPSAEVARAEGLSRVQGLNKEPPSAPSTMVRPGSGARGKVATTAPTPRGPASASSPSNATRSVGASVKEVRPKSSFGGRFLLRILHPSGTGGTTLCRLLKSVPGVKMTEFQRIHNCNLEGSGPQIIGMMRKDTPWRFCSALDRLAPSSNCFFMENGIDAELPCDNENIKTVMLFRGASPGNLINLMML